MLPRLWLIRHGETEWTLSGAHTGRTDIALTEKGREEARRIARVLAGRRFALVLTSPLQRARETCELAGYGDVAQPEPNLHEWDYGDYEGKTSREIQEQAPGWSLWVSGVPHGEAIEQVAARAQAVIGRAVTAGGDVALFGHGHMLRILAATWLALPPQDGRLFMLGPAAISVLGYEHDARALERWNVSCDGMA